MDLNFPHDICNTVFSLILYFFLILWRQRIKLHDINYIVNYLLTFKLLIYAVSLDTIISTTTAPINIMEKIFNYFSFELF